MKANDIKSAPFFFIIGRPRSGTTLLRTLFDAHPNVSIPLEAPVIKHLSDKYKNVNPWDKKKLDEFYNDTIKIWKFNSWTIDLKKLEHDILSLKGQITFQDLIKVVYLNYISFFEKENIEIIGDKNPSYSTCTRKIFKIFPDSKYIHLTRDPRDNVLSILKVDFEAPLIPLIAYRWRYSAKRIARLKQDHPESFYTIKYEDFVQNPNIYLKEMCNFLSVEYSETMLRFYEKKDEVMAKVTEEKFIKYHSSLFNPINADKIYGWKEQMKDKDVRLIDLVVGKYAKIQGYNQKYNSFSILNYLQVIPGVVYGRLSYIITIFIDLIPFNLRMKIRNKGSLLAKIYWSIYRKFKK